MQTIKILSSLVLCSVLVACDRAPEGQGSVLAAAEQVQRDVTGALHRELIGDADLPPEGTRSLLDLWLAEQGAIPFPFDRFLDALGREDRDGRRPLAVLIPDGRSLLKADGTFAEPRVVVATDMRPPDGALLQPDFRGRIYLGLTAAANEIEVMSYNPEAGRFEFQLITDYCEGCNPRLLYARRAICLTCHQGGVPIFSVRPWEETQANPEIASRIAQAQTEPYFGVPHKVGLDVPDAIDNLTNQGAVLIATQRAWLDGCGAGTSGEDCRRGLWRMALEWIYNPASLDGQAEALRALQSAQWPAQGIPVPGNDLRSRNPLESGLYADSIWQQWRRLLFGKPSTQSGSGDKIADFEQLPRLPAEFDPLIPRPPKTWIQADQPDAVLGLALLLTPNDRERILTAAQDDLQRLRAAVAAMPVEVFAAAPLQRLRLLESLLVALEQTPPARRFADLGALSAPILEGEPELEVAASSPLKPFAEYCFACHRGNPSARLNFLSGADEDTVLRNLRAANNLGEVLDWERYLGTARAGQLMPPPDSWQREALEQAMQAAAEDPAVPSPLARMQEQVPRLFDF